MTIGANRKYNPGFLTDDELVASFCIRTNELESLVEMLRDCTGESNRHQIVIGPRGSGKTMLLLRVAAEVRRSTDLARSFFPIVFAEESYEVGTAGEFWLECLARLTDQAPHRDDAPDLRRTFEDLRNISDDQSLEERCLTALLDFSDLEGKRLVLLVENLNMMFGDIGDPDVGWRLRKILQTEPRIVLIASATSPFDEIDKPDRAMYDLLRPLTLRPLGTNECAVLWETVSGQSRPPGTIRSLEILTGGSPRLLAIVARFGAGLAFHELMDNLLGLVDDHTEYFKSHVESLPPQERRVYLALADIWKPALTKEIAARARLETSKCSAQLSRLVERGSVLVTGGSARRKQYYLSERMYNIYYLLRRNGRPNRLIEALIQFMASFYSPDELGHIASRMEGEAKGLAPDMRTLHELAYAKLMALPAFTECRGRVPSGTEEERVQVAMANALFDRGVALSDLNRMGEALPAFDEIVTRFHESKVPALLGVVAKAMFNKGVALDALDRPVEALAAYEALLELFGNSDVPSVVEQTASAFVNKGATLATLDRLEAALVAWDDVLHRFGESVEPALLEQVARALVNRGIVLGALDRPEGSLAASDEVLRRFNEGDGPAFPEQVAGALVNKGAALGALDRPEEQLVAYEEVLRRFSKSDVPEILEQVATALLYRGMTLGTLDRREEALTACDQVINRFGDSNAPTVLEQVATALFYKGITLDTLDRPEEALSAWGQVLHRFGEGDTPVLLKTVAGALVCRGATLGVLGRPAEALAIYEEVLRRFERAEVPALREATLIALRNKGIALAALGLPEEALASCKRFLDRFREGAGPTLFEQTPRALVDTLMRISVDLGPAEVRDMIRASPAWDLLLPLATALEQEIGQEPRVAREVEEVAADIRREMAVLRNAGEGSARH